MIIRVNRSVSIMTIPVIRIGLRPRILRLIREVVELRNLENTVEIVRGPDCGK